MRFRKFFFESSLQKLDVQGDDEWYYMNVMFDEFVHFTSVERIDEILKANKLLFMPPYQKFGTDAVNAISTVFGEHLPGVQYTHIQGEVGAILFKTNLPPHRATVEEVIWYEDVPFTQVSQISKQQAISKINAAPESVDEMAHIIYKPYNDFVAQHKALQKKWFG